MKDLGRSGVICPGSASADVRLMCTVTAEGEQLPAHEDRVNDGPVGQMVAACFIGIAQDKDVAVRNFTGESLEDSLDRKGAATGVDRQAVRLRHHVAVLVADEAREVMRLTEDRTARRARHHPAHLPGDVVELLLDEREADRVINHDVAPPPTRIEKLSWASISRRSSAPIRIVVFRSSINAGPSIS